MFLFTMLAVALLGQASADTPTNWQTELDNGRQAYARQQYTEALARFTGAEKFAREQGDEAAAIECLRLLAAVQRDSGDPVQAQRLLESAAAQSAKVHGENSLELAAILEEIAAVNRAQGRSPEALAAIEKAINIRETHVGGPRADLARDLTAAAMLHQQAAQADQATELLKRAIQELDMANPGDPQCLPALEALAYSYRDRAQYAEAEPLLLRALRLREAVSGPDSSELIPAVDSLAYVEFGLKKMPEAEGLYKRLRTLWEKNTGPDHPMVALTLDKMAEFYAHQQRYEEAEKCATTALALRASLHIASLNQTGRVLLMEAKLAEAEDLYRRTLQIGDLAKAPDEVLDPPLRIYAKILRELKRPSEAETLDKRVKEALDRKADREGRLPSPVKLPGQ